MSGNCQPSIRHYGMLSSSQKLHVLPLTHLQLESHYEYPQDNHWKLISSERLGYDPDACPLCKKLTTVTIFTFDRRRPPCLATALEKLDMKLLKMKKPITKK